MTSTLRGRIELTGLTAAPSQVVGAVRLVPLLRDEPVAGLRLYAVKQPAALTVARLDRRTVYAAYVPHALVAELPGIAQPRASAGAQLVRPDADPSAVFRVQVIHRLARKEGRGRLRFLPQHVGLDGYLSVGFSGPNTRWPEYSREVLSRGLSPRVEEITRALELPGFRDALRTFERHPRQVGVLVFVADAFALALVTPHPDDYRQLHRALLRDMLGELLLQYAVLHPRAPALWQPIDASRVDSLAALSQAVEAARAEWGQFAGLMASGLVAREVDWQVLHRLGRFRLQRFLPDFNPSQENHLGEAIVDEDGAIAYLKTYRLSAAQARRGRLLATLVASDWRVDACAEALRISRAELLARLRNNGLGRLLKPGALALR